MRKDKSSAPKSIPVLPVAPPGSTGIDADALLQGLPWGVVMLDAHGTVLRLNEQAAHWWGVLPVDVQGKRLGPATAGTLPADLLQSLQQVASGPLEPSDAFFLPQHRQWIALSSARQGDAWVVGWHNVTALKQREHQLRDQQATSDALLRRTEAVAGTGSYEMELATARFHFSDGLFRLFGEEPGAFVPGLALIDARSHPDDIAGVQQVMARAIADQQPYYYQRRIYHSDGQLRTLEAHGRVECDALGQPVKLLGLLQDVTEREQAAQELRRAKDALAQRATDSYAALYTSMDEGFCIVEVLFDEDRQPIDYRFLDVNPAFEQQTGLRGALGQTMRELVPAIEPFSSQVYGRVALTGEPTRFEAHVESMGRWFDVNAFAVGPLENRHVAVLFTDITERKRTEEALRQSEARYRALFANMEQGFCLMGKVATAPDEPSDYRYLAVNPAFELHTGLRDAVGRTIRELVPGVEPHIVAIYDDAVASGEPQRFEEHVAELGLWFEAEAVPEAQPGHLAVLFSNVSVRRRAEQTLRESEARQTYLLALSDALRPVDDAAAVQATVTNMALRYFATDRCYYAEVAGNTVTIRQDAARPGLQSVANVYSLRDMPLFRTVMQERRPVVVPDVDTSPVMDEALKQLCRDNGILAYVNVLVRRHGQLVGMLCLAQAIPRAWTALEVALLEETAERTWTAVEQARAEESLRQSEEQFRLLVTATSDTVYRMSADWTHMQQLLGKNFLADTLDRTPDWMDAYIPAEDLPLVQATIARAIDQKSTFELEHRVRRADGTIGWTYSRAIPVLGAQGELTGWLGAASDVSARKQAETGLQESEQRQRMLIENLPGAAVFVVDRKLRYRLAAGEALRRAGHVPADFVGHPVRKMVSPTHWPAFRDSLRQALAGTPFEHEHEQGGRIFLTRGVPRPGPAGRIDAVLAVSYDITDRKAAEEALRVSEAKYRTLFENMDQGFGISEVLPGAGPGGAVDLRWLEINPQFERLTGVAYADVVGGQTVRQLVPDIEDEWLARYERVSATGEPVRFEQHSLALGHWFDTYIFALEGPAPRRVAALFTNITARKEAEQDLRHAEEHQRERLEQQVAERTWELSESRHLLQTVFDASPTAIVVMRVLHDAAGQVEDFEILIYNEFNKQVVGRDDLAGQRFSAMFPQTVPTGILARLLQVATTGEPADFEQWYEGEGMRHWFRHIVVRQDGLLVLTSEVITVRKQLEQAQAQSLALLLQSEAVAVMGSWEYDLTTQKLTWSEGLYKLLGQPVGSAVRLQSFLDPALDDDRPAAAQLVRTLTTEPRSFDTTLRLRIGDAVKTVRFKAAPVPDAPGVPERVLGVCLDVSDGHRLEAENLALKLDHHKELLLAILQAQEDERQRLGEVLHNGLGQVLYAAKLRLDQLDTPALQALPVLAGLHRQSVGLLAEAMRQNRTLAHELVPTSLLDFGLAAAVRDVCRNLSTPRLRLGCHVWGEELPLPQPVQVTLFRLAQELALNIARHAGATEASLELETMAGGVSLRAEDNGRGFDPRTVAEGLGLRTVRQAVALLGGTVAVDSSPEFGTHVRLHIPLPLFT